MTDPQSIIGTHQMVYVTDVYRADGSIIGIPVSSSARSLATEECKARQQKALSQLFHVEP